MQSCSDFVCVLHIITRSCTNGIWAILVSLVKSVTHIKQTNIQPTWKVSSIYLQYFNLLKTLGPWSNSVFYCDTSDSFWVTSIQSVETPFLHVTFFVVVLVIVTHDHVSRTEKMVIRYDYELHMVIISWVYIQAWHTNKNKMIYTSILKASSLFL